MSSKLQVAIITEFHPVDMINFHRMFWSFDDCECYIQSLDMFAADDENRSKYDVVVYYNLSTAMVAEDTKVRQYFENELGSTKQGVVLLHHAICCYRRYGWNLWKELSGITNRDFVYHWDQTVHYEIKNPNHAIMQGVEPWTMVDETYTMSEPDFGDNDILITTDHPNSMKAIAWTRTYKNSRVFCYESGHDNQAYTNKNFLKVLHNAIHWCANK